MRDMAMGKRRRRATQASMWVATNDLPRSAAHPLYTRLNHTLDQHNFDGYVERLCHRFYADDGRPGLPPGRYFRLLLIGHFEGLDASPTRTPHALDATFPGVPWRRASVPAAGRFSGQTPKIRSAPGTVLLKAESGKVA
jgi:hypothetical protein